MAKQLVPGCKAEITQPHCEWCQGPRVWDIAFHLNASETGILNCDECTLKFSDKQNHTKLETQLALKPTEPSVFCSMFPGVS